jgi:predicted DNA-binding protein (UPF0251 family)
VEENHMDALIDYSALLDAVDVSLDSHEVTYDPDILDRLVSDSELVQRYLEMRQDADGFGRQKEIMIERIKECAKRILPLKEKICVLALLNTGASYREVGRQLGIPKDSVRRALERATAKLTDVLSPDQPLVAGAKIAEKSRLKFFVIKDSAAARKMRDFVAKYPIRSISHAFDEAGVLTICVLVE